jgi:hypothetical protein
MPFPCRQSYISRQQIITNEYTDKHPGDFMKIELIQDKIFVIRGEKVMLDRDLAALYGVATKRLNEQTRRKSGRFPKKFMFQLTRDEYDFLRSHFATLESGSLASGRGQYSKYLPFVFTEHGALMASTVLNSEKAVKMSIYIIEAFVKLRELASSHREIVKRLDELERKVGGHDTSIKQIVSAIRQLMAPPSKPGRKIGF